MKYRIVLYIQAWEIDDLERIIRHLILSSYYIDSNDTVILDVTLNVSDVLINWDSSSLNKDYFIDKFLYIKTLASQYYNVEFDMNVNIQGCVDKRRDANLKSHDFIIWLDPDVFFSVYTLPYLIHSTKQITDVRYVLSPQIIKYWDSSWDCLTYHKFLHEPANHRDYFDMYSLDDLVNSTEKQLVTNNQVKFAGGWFNLFTAQIFRDIEIPKEFGSYGWEDLYVMICCNYLKIQQYNMQGVIVSEIGNTLLNNKNYHKPYISINPMPYNKISEKEFKLTVSKFIKVHNNEKNNFLYSE